MSYKCVMSYDDFMLRFRTICKTAFSKPMSQNQPVFDKEAFKKTLKLKALRIPTKRSSEFRDQFRPYLLSLPRVKPIQHDSDSFRVLLFNENITDDLPSVIEAAASTEDVELIDFDLELNYDRLTTNEVLKHLLPDDVPIPTAFESVGHVAHVNLRPEHLPYRFAIGQILIDKNPSIKTVVNKVGIVENEYRLMEYEVLAGDASLKTEVRQSGCRFQLDFGKVYWNSRLEFEHGRLVQTFRPGEVILDLMAGIGPFAIPAAKKGCKVIANDKNPESYRYLKRNVALNKVTKSVFPFNVDARFCLRLVLGQEGPLANHYEMPALASKGKETKPKPSIEKPSLKSKGKIEAEPPFELPSVPLLFDHVVMNYPQYAISFLDMFRGAFDSEIWTEDRMPMIHCYAFMKSESSEDVLQKLCEATLGEGAKILPSFHKVRDVAPSKIMTCISFRLPFEIAIAKDAKTTSPKHPTKRKRVTEAK